MHSMRKRILTSRVYLQYATMVLSCCSKGAGVTMLVDEVVEVETVLKLEAVVAVVAAVVVLVVTAGVVVVVGVVVHLQRAGLELHGHH